MTSNDMSEDQTNLIPTTIIDEEPELTTDVDLTQINSKSYLSKLCIKFSKGYKSYTIIQLSTSTFTLIALTLPYILHTCGIVEGAIIFTIIGVISFYTMTLMLELIMKTNAISYYHFLNYNIGKGVSYFYQGANMTYSFCIIMMMCFLSVELLVDLIQGFNTFEIDFIYRIMIAMIFAVAQFGFALKPFEFIKLIAQYMTLVIVVLSFIFILVVMIMDCRAINANFDLFEHAGFNILYVIGIIFVSFNSHNNLVECFKVFNMRTKKRGNKVILMHVIFIFLFFLAFSYVGYLLFLSSSPMIKFNTIILFIINSHLSSPFANVLLFILKILFILSCQFEIISIISKRKDEIKFISHNQLSVTQNILICLLVPLISNGLALFIRNILTIVGVAGGVCTCIISFVLPCYAYKRLIPGDTLKHLLNYLIMFAAIVAGLMITGYALYDSVGIERNVDVLSNK